MMITASDFSGSIKAIPSDTINIPGPESKYNGVPTTTTANKLIDITGIQGGFTQVLDTNGNITNQGVQVGDVVYNSSTARSAIAYVTAIDSATSLTLSADIFIAPNLDSYNIYSGNGVGLNSEENSRLVTQFVFDNNPAVTTDTTAGYKPNISVAITPSGGTYTLTGGEYFGMQTKSDGTMFVINIQNNGGAFSNTSLLGQTIEFDQASIRAAILAGSGVADLGTGDFIITINSALVESTPTGAADQRNAKPFQLYCGGTAANPPLACDIYATTIDGDNVFFEGVQPGTMLPVVISKVNTGSAAGAGNGNINTLTTATGRYVALN